MSHYLLTGASGFLGRRVLAGLLARGDACTALGRASVDGVKTVRADLTSEFNLSCDALDCVVHAAGLAHRVARAPSEAEQFLRVNLLGTKHLVAALERASNIPAQMIFISTVAVYGVESGRMLDEGTPAEAQDPYGRSKREAEEYLRDWCAKAGVRLVILRLPLLVGAHAPGNFGAMARAIRARKYMGVGDGSARRSMCWVEDVARLIPELSSREGVYHLTDGAHPSFLELETAITEALGVAPVRRLPLLAARLLARAGDLARLIGRELPFNSRALSKMTSTLTFSDERARRELGWSPAPVVSRMKEIMSS